MMGSDAERVRLRRAPEYVGRVVAVSRGRARVQFDGGGAGVFAVDDLEQADGKAWPPDLETKVGC